MTYVAVILTYLLALIALGSWKARRIHTQADFAVAGRSLTPWVLVGTMLATWIGTGSILGNAGKTYQTGMAAFILPLGGVLGIAILTRIAARARSFECLTVPEILGERYGQGARLLSVVALVLAYLVIVSYQYNAGGAVLQTILTDGAGHSLLSPTQATLAVAVFIVAYTMLAGLVSVAYTDVGNGIIMSVSLVIALPVLWVAAGGWATGCPTAGTPVSTRSCLPSPYRYCAWSWAVCSPRHTRRRGRASEGTCCGITRRDHGIPTDGPMGRAPEHPGTGQLSHHRVQV